MIAATEQLSVAARPLPFVRRTDLEEQTLEIHGRRWWRVKDPIAMRFWQLGDEEHFLFSQLRKGASLEQLQRSFAERFAPRRIELSALQQFLTALFREGLISSTAPGQGSVLLNRHQEQQKRLRAGWLNLLAIRFPGIDPSRLLDWIYPKVAFCFHSISIATFVALVLSALVLAVVNADEFHRRSPLASEFLAPSNLFLVAAVMAGAKICHELGHALVCRQLGGRCHELGVMLLVFTPCLYCNVSDAWLMPSRWRRLAISGAGIAVELVLASAATWLWWWSEPGWFAEICWNMMVVCSVNTLLFNGNPLLRYDGYFLFSDFFDVPNLRAAGDEWLRQFTRRIFAGGEAGEQPPALHDRPILVRLYAITSLAYRWALTVLIWWFVYEWFREHGLTAIGVSIVAFSAALLVGGTLRGGWTELRNSVRYRWASPGRAAISLIVCMAIVAAISAVPIPRNIRAPAVIRPANAETVYIVRAGTLVHAITDGTLVKEGDELVRLQDEDIDHEIIRLTGEEELLKQQIATYRRRQVQQTGRGADSAGAQIPSLEKQLAAVQSLLEQRHADRERLILHAPRNGIVLRLRDKPSRHAESQELDTWSGNPLDRMNQGAYFEAGTPLCQVGSMSEREAVVTVEQAAIDAVAVGQRVDLRVDERPGQRLVGRVERIAALRSESAPAELIAKQLVPVSRDGESARLPGAFYEVFVSLSPGEEIPFGASGTARIQTPPAPLYQRLWALWPR